MVMAGEVYVCIPAAISWTNGVVGRVGWNFALGLLPYNDRMRRTRRFLQEGMSVKAMPVRFDTITCAKTNGNTG